MTDRSDDPDYWLGRAEVVRDMAEQISDPQTKEILEDLAKGYERMAEYARSALQSAGDDH
jgi:hypothetical protein